MPPHKLFSKIDRFQHVCYAKDPHKKIYAKDPHKNLHSTQLRN